MASAPGSAGFVEGVMSEITMRAAGNDAADADACGSGLGASFVADPVWSWVFPKSNRPEKLRRFFTEDARRMHLRHGCSTLALDGARPVGAALWDPPGQWRVSLADEARLAPSMLSIFGTRIIATLRLLSRVQAQHYVAPHYYLFALGVDPAAQGRGVGVQLVAPVLARCDEEGMPAYLESLEPAQSDVLPSARLRRDRRSLAAGGADVDAHVAVAEAQEDEVTARGVENSTGAVTGCRPHARVRDDQAGPWLASSALMKSIVLVLLLTATAQADVVAAIPEPAWMPSGPAKLALAPRQKRIGMGLMIAGALALTMVPIVVGAAFGANSRDHSSDGGFVWANLAIYGSVAFGVTGTSLLTAGGVLYARGRRDQARVAIGPASLAVTF